MPGLEQIQRDFEDILKGPLVQAPGPVSAGAHEYPELAASGRAVQRSSYSRLRRLLDAITRPKGRRRRRRRPTRTAAAALP